MESRSEGLSDPPTSSSMEKDFLLHQIAYGDSVAQQLACRESPSLSSMCIETLRPVVRISLPGAAAHLQRFPSALWPSSSHIWTL